MITPAARQLRCCLALGIFCVLIPAAFADNPGSNWSLGVWQSDEGLPNNNIPGLTQTPDGYIWLAMPDGLARFDGNEFEDFPTGTFAPGYEDQRIRAMIQTGQGGLCLGIEPGHLIFLNHGKAEIFTNQLPQATIEDLAQDGEGAIWIAYHGGNVCCVKDGMTKHFGVEQNLPRGGGACALTSDSNGQIWFSKGFETGVYRNGRFKTLIVLQTQGAHIAAARDNGIWIVSNFQLYRFVEGKPLIHCGRLKDGTIRGMITKIFEDSSGGVWIGTSASGLFHYDGAHFESVATSDREILSITEDREKNIWVGTGGGGLDRIRPQAIALENSGSGAPFEAVQSLCEDTNGTIWAVTPNGGIIRNSAGHWETVSNSNFGSTMASCIAADKSGGVWVATGEHKMFHWQDGRVSTLGQGDGLEARAIHGLLVSRVGDLWICGEAPDAIQCLHDGRFQNVPLPAGTRHFRTMAEDNDGNIWVGGDRGALLKISDGHAIDESSLAGDLQKPVRCLRAGSDGILWIGFSAGGLGRLKNGKFSRIDVAQGLYVGAIDQMVEDGLGSMWFGSDRGIFRVRENDLNDVAAGRAPVLWSIHYGRSEELPGVQARYGFSPGGLKSRDGKLWIPMRTGLALIRPDQLHEDLQPPQVLVNRVTLDDKTVALYGGDVPTDVTDLPANAAALRLPSKFNRLEFEFTALSFGPPENIHFRYQLVGFDNQWHDAGNDRSAIYPRLPPGNYFFHVKGCNSDAIWNNDGFSIALTVPPLFWQTWSFKFAAIFLFTVIIVAIVRYVSFRRLRMKLQRLEQQAALDKERARIARDIHDDLGGSLTQIALLTGLAQRDAKSPEKSGEHVQQISTATHHVIKSLDEIVWAVNPRNDTLPDLVNYLGHFAVDFLRTAGIQCHADLPDHPPRLPVTAETRHNLYLVVKETLNNIARHSRATEVRFRVNTSGNSASIVIEDNGQGFRNGEADAFADGVRNMRQRMEEIGGQFRVDSTTGKGTRIELSFALRKN